ncbi:MAG: glycosyltransferase family 4 protein [Brumimicrobium sp.]|nr:glycosyltransferase family 4 protein [Brumimicrobium sp.]
MKLLIITQYFPPEVGAPQNRLFELAQRLIKNGVEVHVLTAMPNYPVGEVFPEYRKKKYLFEELDGISVHRSGIYATSSKSILKRLRNYFSFVFSSYRKGGKHIKGNFDFVLCESPPLFLGISAYKLSKKFNAQFIFNVSDLWPESAEKLGLVSNRFFLNLAYKLEKYLYKRADLVTGQTQGIVRNIEERYPDVKTYWLPNGVDLEYFNPEKIEEKNIRKEHGFTKDDILFLYAGILGHAQGLDIILKVADKLRGQQRAKFLIMGSGPLKDDLIQMKTEKELDNVFFREIVPKKEMPSIIKAVDVALIPLKKLDLFKGAIPSKIFENCAMKKMILLGVEGEAKELFIDKGDAGFFFIPEDTDSLADAVRNILKNPEIIEKHGEAGRSYVKQYFNRDKIASDFYLQLEKLKKKA